MNEQFDGYVIYAKDKQNKLPFAVVSEDHECKANSEYIPYMIKQILVQIEDRRFYEHNGIDIKGITRAAFANLRSGKIVQGGSTITQQLARNILRDNRKSISRKLKETTNALKLESLYTKDEILNLYFNNVYFGNNLRGIRAAGFYYFGKDVSSLTHSELLYLLTILRGPNYYNNHPKEIQLRLEKLSKILLERSLISKNRHLKNINTKFTIQNNNIQIIKSKVVQYITEGENDKNKKILSTIDINTHKYLEQFVKNSKYPVSIIAMKNNKVIGFASSYGTDYPFILKTNVGSTLKPFLYCFFRENGVLPKEEFNAYNNSLNLKVREVSFIKPYLNISEALYYSNNNTFINAANKVGLNTTLQYLANVFNHNVEDLFPSSILGATKNGISLYELAFAYSTFFNINNLSDIKKECLSILNENFNNKLGFKVKNAFLKTGTTNCNKERYAVLGNSELTLAVLRNENIVNDKSKEGSLMNQIAEYINKDNNYTWR